MNPQLCIEVPGYLIGAHLHHPIVNNGNHYKLADRDKSWEFDLYTLMDMLGSYGAEQEDDYHFVFKRGKLHIVFRHDAHAVAFKLWLDRV